MTTFRATLCALAIVAVALFNVFDILPDWTTVAAVTVLPFFAAANGMKCRLLERDS